jgi:hypothetical protein
VIVLEQKCIVWEDGKLEREDWFRCGKHLHEYDDDNLWIRISLRNKFLVALGKKGQMSA